MAVGFSAAVANSVLDSLCRAVAWTPPVAVYLQLHTGSPGAAGSSNVATNSTRKLVTFGTSAASGSIANTVALTWTFVPASEDYTYFSLWDAVSAGVFQISGTIASNPVGAGGTFDLAIGAVVIPATVAA